MAATNATITLTNTFNDNETQNVEIGELDPTAVTISSLKTKIANFNDSTQRATIAPGFDDSFVSKNGSPFKEISAAKIEVVNKTLIF